MASVILGTAGHIDHGKTALVKALTGVDTDRLAEEKARGITIELGFTELVRDDAPHLGIVDVPGHRGFIRMMVAGATGMDLVLLVVAADEGVMPQTREHLSIVELLDVSEVVVALTKSDLVDAEWLQLVDAEVAEMLAPTRYAGAPRIATSVETGAGLDALLSALYERAGAVRRARAGDVARLPVDRVFTIQGTGTVATGTLWSGTLARGGQVRIFPGGATARLRGVQVHGRDVDRAEAGDRTAVALAGVDHSSLDRGAALVAGPGWAESWMLTVRVRLLSDSPVALEERRRVRVHLGTAEVMARCALLEDGPVEPSATGWVQLRLEEPLLARARDRLILRSYSPMTTIGGGEVAEPTPPKRKGLEAAERLGLAQVLDGDASVAVRAVLELAGTAGVAVEELPIRAGFEPAAVDRTVTDMSAPPTSGGRVFAAEVVTHAEAVVLAALESEHARDPVAPTVPLEVLRGALPGSAHADLGQLALDRAAARGALELAAGGARSPGHRPSFTPEQSEARERLRAVYAQAGLTAPTVAELPPELAGRPDLWSLLKHLEAEGELRLVADGMYVGSEPLDVAGRAIVRTLGGRSDLRPADFREALAVTRKHLIPLLNHFDGLGVTVRRGDVREVPGGDRSGR